MSESKAPEQPPMPGGSSSPHSVNTNGPSLGGVASQPLSTQMVSVRKTDFKMIGMNIPSGSKEVVAAIYRMLKFLFTPDDYHPNEPYSREKLVGLLEGRVSDVQATVNFLEGCKGLTVLQELYHWGSFMERLSQTSGRLIRPDAKQSQLSLTESTLSIIAIFPFPCSVVRQNLSIRGEAADALEVDFTLDMSLADAVYSNMQQHISTDSAVYQQIQQCKTTLFAIPLTAIGNNIGNIVASDRIATMETCCEDFLAALTTAEFIHVAPPIVGVKGVSTATQRLRQYFPAIAKCIDAYLWDPTTFSPLEEKPAIEWGKLLTWWQDHPAATRLKPFTLLSLGASSEPIAGSSSKVRTVLTLYYRLDFSPSPWPLEISFDISELSKPKPLQAVVHTQHLSLMWKSEKGADLVLLAQLAQRFWAKVEFALQSIFSEYIIVEKANAAVRLQGNEAISVMEYKALGSQKSEQIQFKLSDECGMFLQLCRIDVSRLTFKEQVVFFSAFHVSWVNAVDSSIRIEQILRRHKSKSDAKLQKNSDQEQKRQEASEDDAVRNEILQLAKKLQPILRRQVLDGIVLTNLIPSMRTLAGARKERLTDVLRPPQPQVTTTAAVVESSMSSSTSSVQTTLQTTASSSRGVSESKEPSSQPMATSFSILPTTNLTPTANTSPTETKKTPENNYFQAQEVAQGRLINKLKKDAKEGAENINPSLPETWRQAILKDQTEIEKDLIVGFWRDTGVKEEAKDVVPYSDKQAPWLRTAVRKLVYAQRENLASINPNFLQNVFMRGLVDTLRSRNVYPSMEYHTPHISVSYPWIFVSCGFSKYKFIPESGKKDERHFGSFVSDEERHCIVPVKMTAKMWVIENPPLRVDAGGVPVPLTQRDFFKLDSIKVYISPADVEVFRLHGFFNNWFSDLYRAAFRESNLLALQQGFDIDHAQLLELQKKMQEAKSAVSNATQSTLEKYLSKYLYDRTLQMELDKFEQYVQAASFTPAEKERLLSLTYGSYRKVQQLCAVIAAARNSAMSAPDMVKFSHTNTAITEPSLIIKVDDLLPALTEPAVNCLAKLEKEQQAPAGSPQGQPPVVASPSPSLEIGGRGKSDKKGQKRVGGLEGLSRLAAEYLPAAVLQSTTGSNESSEAVLSAGQLEKTLGKDVWDILWRYEQQEPGKMNLLLVAWNSICRDVVNTPDLTIKLVANPAASSIKCTQENTLKFTASYDRFTKVGAGPFACYAPITFHLTVAFDSAENPDKLTPQFSFSLEMSKVDAIFFKTIQVLNPSSPIKKTLETYQGQLHTFQPPRKRLNVQTRKFANAEEYSQALWGAYHGEETKPLHGRRPSIPNAFFLPTRSSSNPSATSVPATQPTEIVYLQRIKKLSPEVGQVLEDKFKESAKTGCELIQWDDLLAWLPQQLGNMKVQPVRKMILEETSTNDDNSVSSNIILLVDYKIISLDSQDIALTMDWLTWPITVRFDIGGLVAPQLIDITLHSEQLLLLFTPQIARLDQFFWQNVAWCLSSSYRQKDAVIEANAYQGDNSPLEQPASSGQQATIREQALPRHGEDLILKPEGKAFIDQISAQALPKQQQLIIYSVYKLGLREALAQFRQSFPEAYSASLQPSNRSFKAIFSHLITRKEGPETKAEAPTEITSWVRQADITKVLREILLRNLVMMVTSQEASPLGDVDIIDRLRVLARRREQQSRELFGESFVASIFGQLSAPRNILKGWDVTKYFQGRSLSTQNTATEPQLRDDVIRYVRGQIICINGKEFKSDNLEWPALKENLRKALLAVPIPLQLAEDIIARMHQHEGGYVAFFNNTFALALSENNRPCKLSTTRFNIQYDARFDDAVTLITETQSDTLSVINPQTGWSGVVAQTPKQAVLGLGGVIRLTLSHAGAIIREVAYAQLFSYHAKVTTELEDFLFPKQSVAHRQPASMPSPRVLLQRASHSIQAVEVREFTRGPLIDAWNNFETVRKKEEKQAAKKAEGDFTRTAWRDMGGRDNQPTTEWLALIEPVATAASQERGSLPRADFIYSKMGGFLSTHLESNFYSMEGTLLLPYLNEPKISRELLKGEVSDPSYKFRITRVYTDYAQEDGSRVKLSKPLTIVAMVEVAKEPRTHFPFKIAIQSIKLSNKDAAALRLQAYCPQWFPSYVTEEYARLNKQFTNDHKVLEKSYTELQKSSKKITNTQRRKILSQIAAYFSDTHYWGQLDTFVIAIQQSTLPLTTRNTLLTTIYRAYQDNLSLSVNILATLDDMEKPQQSRSRLPMAMLNEEGELEWPASSNLQNSFIGSPLLVDLYFWQKIYWHVSVEYRQIASQKEPQGFQEFLTMLGDVPAWFSKSEQLRLYRVFMLSIKEATQQALSVKTVSEAAAESSSTTTLQGKEEAKAADLFSEHELNKIRGALLARIKEVIGLPTAKPSTVLSLLQSLAKTEYEKLSDGFQNGLLRPEGDSTHPTAPMVDSDDDAPGGPGTMSFELPPLVQPNPPPLPTKPPPALPKQLFPTKTRSRSKSLGFFPESDPGEDAGHLRPASVGEAKYPQPLPVQPGGRDLSTGQDVSTGQGEGELSTGEILSQDPQLLDGEGPSRSVSPNSMIIHDVDGEDDADADIDSEGDSPPLVPRQAGGRKG
jgi:hypothetical protein